MNEKNDNKSVDESLLLLVKQKFPGEAPEEILDLLEQYGISPHENEALRVRKCIIHLSKGKKENLPSLVKQAKIDYRDIIVAAEYAPMAPNDAATALESLADILNQSGQQEEAAKLRIRAENLRKES